MQIPVKRATGLACVRTHRTMGDEEPCIFLFAIIYRWRYRCRAVSWLNKCSAKALQNVLYCAMNKFNEQEHIFNIYQVKFKNYYFRYECKLIDLFLASGMSIICFLSYRNLSPTFPSWEKYMHFLCIIIQHHRTNLKVFTNEKRAGLKVQ